MLRWPFLFQEPIEHDLRNIWTNRRFHDSTVVDRVLERARSIRVVVHSPSSTARHGVRHTDNANFSTSGFRIRGSKTYEGTRIRVHVYRRLERAKQDIGLHPNTIPDFRLCLLLVRRTMVVWPRWRTRMVEVYRYRDRMKHRVRTGVRHEVQMRP